MLTRHFPVRPNLEQLKHQAKDLLRAIHRSDREALADLREYKPIDPASAHLADAQFILARSYGLPSWPRLVTACRMTDAISRGDVEAVRALVLRDPQLLTENARGTKESNWGPPMSYAANVGQDQIIQMLHTLGASDMRQAFGRACLQGKIETARKLYAMMENPPSLDGVLGGPAYTLNVAGTELLLNLGARVYDDHGKLLAPIDVVLETDSRNPPATHRILELYVEHGLKLPDTPVMAVYRGRIDLLEDHLRRDPKLLQRTFTHEEIYPPELGCHKDPQATHGTPLAGATLLHLCADYDEIRDRPLAPRPRHERRPTRRNRRQRLRRPHPLFATVVSQPNFWLNHHHKTPEAPFTQLFLDAGANPNARASLRKQLHPGYEIPGMHEYRNVTPLSWGEQFFFQKLVNPTAMRIIAERGGHS